MSQNQRNQPGDGQMDTGRTSNGNSERRQYEGFEGMNYEQRRQPYQPLQSANTNSDDPENGGSGKKQSEEF
jgi:hypothetical protein